MSNSLWHHGLQHAKLLCPSPTPGAYSNSSIESMMPSNHQILCRPPSCLQSFPPSGSFPVSQFFTSGGQSTRVSPSASVLPLNIQDWFPLGNALMSLNLYHFCLKLCTNFNWLMLLCLNFFFRILYGSNKNSSGLATIVSVCSVTSNYLWPHGL